MLLKNKAWARSKLRRLYGHPENVDVWVGGLLETSEEGGRVGPLVRCLIVDQFRRTRDGDRFWYENPSTFTAGQLSQIRQSSLAAVVCDSGDDITSVPPDTFRLINGDKNPLVSCQDIPRVALTLWKECDEYNDGVSVSSAHRRFRRDYGDTHLEDAVVRLQREVERLSAMIDNR